MQAGDYRALSLGSLSAILVALAVWAIVWGPGGGGPAVMLDGPLFVATDDGERRDGVAATGVVAFVNGCILLVEPNAGEVSLVVWHRGTTWDNSSQEIVFTPDRRAGFGDEVRAGGGAYSVGELDASGDVKALLEPCSSFTDSGKVTVLSGTPDDLVIQPGA
ncbi:MAG: hypothetical protein AAGC53_00635 [Actinomycetota bacterium]